MIGQWKLQNGLYAEVMMNSPIALIGFIEISGYKVPSFWSKNGDSADPEFSLAIKRRSIEQDWKKDNNTTILICPQCKQELQIRK